MLDTEDFAHQLHGLARGIAPLPNGEFLAVGELAVESVNCTIARWNGSRWIAMNTYTPTGGNQNSSVVLAHSSGQVFINRRESFAPIGQETIEAWDGISWRIVGTLGAGSSDPNTPTVRAIAELANGDIVVAGNIGGVGAVAAENMLRWDGQAWSALSGRFTRPVNALAVLPNGDLIAGGIFTSANGSPFERLARWDGVVWGSIGAGADRNVNTVTALPDNSFFASGAFEHVGSEFAYRVARFYSSGGESLSSAAHSVIGPIHSIHAVDDEHWYGSGYVQFAGGQVAGTTIEHLASGWLPLAGGLSGGTSSATAITPLQNGSIVYAGSFTQAGGVSASNIARWDGTAWRRLRGGLNFPVEAALAMPGGDLIVGGYFGTADGVATGGIARWDGANWFSLGGSQPVIVHTLVALDNGDLIIGGRFSSVGGLSCKSVARWNGRAWFPLGSGIGGGSVDINALAAEFLPGMAAASVTVVDLWNQLRLFRTFVQISPTSTAMHQSICTIWQRCSARSGSSAVRHSTAILTTAVKLTLTTLRSCFHNLDKRVLESARRHGYGCMTRSMRAREAGHPAGMPVRMPVT